MNSRELGQNLDWPVLKSITLDTGRQAGSESDIHIYIHRVAAGTHKHSNEAYLKHTYMHLVVSIRIDG
jgi:hypothetical protein